MSEQLMDQANILLKQNNFAEAGKIYRQEWETNNNAYAASRYLYCLRKAGYPEAALSQGNKAYSQFPDHLYIKRELVWIYYDLLKQLAEGKKLREAEKIASKLLTLEPESLPLELTFFLIIDLAKEQNKWQIVADWCGKIKPVQLSNENSIVDGKKVKSKRERWYFAYLKSLIELNNWQKVNSLALEAINNYPKEINFKRWYALALAEQGNIDKAISQLEELIIKERQEWYLFQDLSNLYLKKNQPKTALRYACKASLANNEHKIKVKLYKQIAEIALLINKWDLSAKHIQLCKLVRQKEGWKIESNLEELELRIIQKCQDNNISITDYSLEELTKICYQIWRQESYEGLPRQQGIIELLPPDKSFGWIRSDNGEKIFFLQKELPKYLRKENIKINFVLEKSWDHKKGEFSMKAVDIQQKL